MRMLQVTVLNVAYLIKGARGTANANRQTFSKRFSRIRKLLYKGRIYHKPN